VVRFFAVGAFFVSAFLAVVLLATGLAADLSVDSSFASRRSSRSICLRSSLSSSAAASPACATAPRALWSILVFASMTLLSASVTRGFFPSSSTSRVTASSPRPASRFTTPPSLGFLLAMKSLRSVSKGPYPHLRGG
jgi:hypothetical protein